MQVLIVEPEKKPYAKDIDGKLETMQEIVGGLIQVLYPFEDRVALVCNDEGKLLGPPLNRALRNENGQPYDIISGTFFLCAAPADSDDFQSLTEEQVAKYEALYRTPEIFINLGGHILCVPAEDLS